MGKVYENDDDYRHIVNGLILRKQRYHPTSYRRWVPKGELGRGENMKKGLSVLFDLPPELF